MREIEVFEGSRLNRTPPLIDQKQLDSMQAAFVGVDAEGKEAYVAVDESLLSKHILFVGGIGTGKTTAIYQLIDQLKQSMTEQDVMVIFDSKGDFLEKFKSSDDGSVVISNDKNATGATQEDYWNVFNEISPHDELEVTVNEIAKTLFYEATKSSGESFFPNAAKDLFASVLLHMFRAGMKKNNQNLRLYLDSLQANDYKKMLNSYDDTRSLVSYVEGDNDSKQASGVLSSLHQVVRDIFIGNFKKPGTLSLRNLIKQKGGRTIFIEYDLGLGNLLTPIYRLLFDMAIKESLSREKSEGNVYLVIDEFRLLPNLQHIENAINFGRSLGVKVIAGIQNVEQIYASYGEHQARSILSGFSTKISFRLGDGITRNYVQGLFGKNRKIETRSQTIALKGISDTVYTANVVEDWDLTQLGTGEAVIGLPGVEPFWFKFTPVL